MWEEKRKKNLQETRRGKRKRRIFTRKVRYDEGIQAAEGREHERNGFNLETQRLEEGNAWKKEIVHHSG